MTCFEGVSRSGARSWAHMGHPITFRCRCSETEAGCTVIQGKNVRVAQRATGAMSYALEEEPLPCETEVVSFIWAKLLIS